MWGSNSAWTPSGSWRCKRSEEQPAEDTVEVEVDQPHGQKAAPLKTIEQLFKEKGKEGFDPNASKNTVA